MAQVGSETKKRLARELEEHGLIKFGEFTLKSGIVSPFYIDLRQAQSFPSTLQAVADCFGEMLSDIEPDVYLAGVPEAGTPLATATGFQTKRKLLQPRKVVKAHGTKSSVEGSYSEGDRVVLLDDLITKGDSKLEAIEQVEAAGLRIERFLVLIDRQQGGIEMISEKGYPIEAALTITELVDLLASDGRLPNDKYNQILSFVGKQS